MKGRPRIFDRAVEHSIRVRYSETDRMGIVYHAHYLVWFEIGRTEFCRAAGFPYRRMEEDGVLIPVTEAECVYRRSARYDDTLRVRTRIGEAGSRGLSFFYEVFGEAPGRPIAEGRTRHVFTGLDGRPISIPPRVRGVFSAFLGQPFG
jgi:acyl-CoA thioester hydrolase